METQPVDCRYPRPGWVEQDARQILERQLDTVKGLLTSRGVKSKEIAAIGITNQRETVVVWDRRTGMPLAPAINWQCRRTAEFCAELAKSPHAHTITSKTGLVIDAYFPGAKFVGFSITSRVCGREPRPARRYSAQWTVGLSGISPAARCTPPTLRTRRGLCS